MAKLLLLSLAFAIAESTLTGADRMGGRSTGTLLSHQGVQRLRRAPLSARRVAAETTTRIPHILHHIYFPSKADYKNATENPYINLKAEWREACRVHHYNWQYMFWELPAAEKFVEEHVPWFLDIFNSLPSPVFKGDAFRYVIMKVLGGLYLDLDVECWRDVTPFLENSDLVLQGFGSHQPIANGMIASTAGHPIWEKVLRRIEQVLNEPAKGRPVERILNTVGPNMFSGVIQSALGLFNTPEDKKKLVGRHETQEWGTITVYSIGTWYIPCEFSYDNKTCLEVVAINRGLGTQSMKTIAGNHHYSLSWFNREAPKMMLYANWTGLKLPDA